MHKALLGRKLAVLVANGFCEKDLTEMQRALQKTGANIRIVSMDQGLVNSWNGLEWGLNFAADQALNEALGADYTMLVIPGGRRSVDKLMMTAHTRRFIGSFMDSRKPVVAFDEALELLVFSEKLAGRTVTGPEKCKEDVEKAGAEWSDTPYVVDGTLMTGGSVTVARDEYIAAAVEFLTSSFEMEQAA